MTIEIRLAKYWRCHPKYRNGNDKGDQAAVDYQLTDGSQGHVKLEWQEGRQGWQCENSSDLLGSCCPILTAINQALVSHRVTKSVHPHKAHKTIIERGEG